MSAAVLMVPCGPLAAGCSPRVSASSLSRPLLQLVWTAAAATAVLAVASAMAAYCCTRGVNRRSSPVQQSVTPGTAVGGHR